MRVCGWVVWVWVGVGCRRAEDARGGGAGWWWGGGGAGGMARPNRKGWAGQGAPPDGDRGRRAGEGQEKENECALRWPSASVGFKYLGIHVSAGQQPQCMLWLPVPEIQPCCMRIHGLSPPADYDMGAHSLTRNDL